MVKEEVIAAAVVEARRETRQEGEEVEIITGAEEGATGEILMDYQARGGEVRVEEKVGVEATLGKAGLPKEARPNTVMKLARPKHLEAAFLQSKDLKSTYAPSSSSF